MDASFTLAIRSDINEIPGVSTRLEEAMEAAAFSPESILDTQLAVEEAITNVIVHGYKNPEGTIQVSGTTASDHLTVEIVDHAPQFDPLSIPEPDIDADMSERQIGGLGVYLLRQVMDEFSYRYEEGKNILTLRKNK
ncbi:MAG: ATP-binding protein [Methanomicrobiales archaeon]|nr:ATP-binding protein [Methanomicrobiales archaeon]